MSSQPPTTPRIDDLKARLRLDPKARHFYPLAEELRKLGQLDEAEKILRDGLIHHGTYLSAWMSLGRILAEKGEHREAVDALLKALALDPGNVVCARLLSTSYLALGDKVEALKKMKLVRAVMPGDDELDEQIAKLEGEIAEPARAAGFAAPAPPELPPAAATAVSPEAPKSRSFPGASAGAPEGSLAPPEVGPGAEQAEAPAAPGEEPAAPTAASETRPPEEWAGEPSAADYSAAETSARSPFITEPDEEAVRPPRERLQAAEVLPEEVFAPAFGGESPSEAAVPESPAPASVAAESFASYTNQEAMSEGTPEEVAPGGASSEPPGESAAEPFPAEEPLLSAGPMQETWPAERDEPATEPAAMADDHTATLTMAELYAKQGHGEAAREIYERVLERDPLNEDVRARLAALSGPRAAAARSPRHEAAARLERWLEKVARREL